MLEEKHAAAPVLHVESPHEKHVKSGLIVSFLRTEPVRFDIWYRLREFPLCKNSCDQADYLRKDSTMTISKKKPKTALENALKKWESTLPIYDRIEGPPFAKSATLRTRKLKRNL